VEYRKSRKHGSLRGNSQPLRCTKSRECGFIRGNSQPIRGIKPQEHSRPQTAIVGIKSRERSSIQDQRQPSLASSLGNVVPDSHRWHQVSGMWLQTAIVGIKSQEFRMVTAAIREHQISGIRKGNRQPIARISLLEHLQSPDSRSLASSLSEHVRSTDSRSLASSPRSSFRSDL
jgi:hypothetical protein